MFEPLPPVIGGVLPVDSYPTPNLAGQAVPPITPQVGQDGTPPPPYK